MFHTPRPLWPALLLVGGALVLALSGRWLSRRGVLHAPVLRTRGVNVVATRGSRAPRVWLCAHVDTKSQPVPTLVRTAGIALEATGYLVASGLAVALTIGWKPHPVWWVFAALVTLGGALPVMLSVVTSRSPGALDNASGVVTVLAAAAQLRDEEIGVLITDAEELGLAGARSWASRAPASAVVLNCDGVDDEGPIVVMFSGHRPANVLDAAAIASTESGVAHQSSRLIPGLLTDSVAFTDAGLASVTFMRGSWRSLARVHSRRDNLSRLRGSGIADTATLMAHTVRAIGGATR